MQSVKIKDANNTICEEKAECRGSHTETQTMFGVRYALSILLIMVYLATGDTIQTSNVFNKKGDNVTLPCANVDSLNCSSTTWLYNPPSKAGAEELVKLGNVKEPNKHLRLRVGSNCSLHIHNVSTEDAGLYTCRQFKRESGMSIGEDAPVHLSVLTISSSPPVTEVKTGSTVTLQCLLYSSPGPGACDRNAVRVRWVNKNGTEIWNNPRDQVKTPSSCASTLTTTLDKKRTVGCQLTDGENGKTHLTLIIKLPGGSAEPKPTTTKSPPTTAAKIFSELPVRLTVFILALIGPLVIGAVVYTKRRIQSQRETKLHQALNFKP